MGHFEVTIRDFKNGNNHSLLKEFLSETKKPHLKKQGQLN